VTEPEISMAKLITTSDLQVDPCRPCHIFGGRGYIRNGIEKSSATPSSNRFYSGNHAMHRSDRLDVGPVGPPQSRLLQQRILASGASPPRGRFRSNLCGGLRM